MAEIPEGNDPVSRAEVARALEVRALGQRKSHLPIRPYTLWALLVLSIQQFQFMLNIGTDKQDPILAQTPLAFQYFWFIAFIVFALTVVAGATALRRYWAGPTLERAGAFLMGLLMLSSIILSIPLAGKVGLTIPGLLLAEWLTITFMFASFAHFWDVGRYIKRVTSLARES